MNGKGCIKKMIAGISAFAVGASTILPAAPVLAAPGASDSMNLTKERIAANDYVLYTVNCGTSDAAVVPNQNSERMGLLQSSVWIRIMEQMSRQERCGAVILQMNILRQ